MSVTFVLSTGRTGSVFLKTALAKCDRVTVAPSGFRHEAQRYVQWQQRSLRRGKLRHHLPMGAWWRWKLYLKRRPLIGRRAHFVEINNALFPLIPELRRAFPGARVIHLIRDPRTFLVSALNRGWALSVHDRRMRASDWGEMSRREWKRLSAVEQLSWFWLRVNRLILDAEPSVTIRFEDLFAPERPGFQQLLDAMGISWDFGSAVSFERVNHTRVSYVPPWEEWPEAWQAEARRAFEEAERDLRVSRWYPDLLG
jgi:hypothetical protein